MKRGSLQYIHLHHKNWFVQSIMIFLYFLSSLVYPGLDFFMNNSVGVSREAEDAYFTGAPGPCSQFWVESSCLFTFVALYVSFLVISCSLLCLSIFHVPGLLFFYFRKNFCSPDNSFTHTHTHTHTRSDTHTKAIVTQYKSFDYNFLRIDYTKRHTRR